MDKLYYIVCEEKGETLFEGRYQGRTRGAAIKFLKEQIGRPGLNGTVFTITEIPVPLIREIVEAIIKGGPIPGASNGTGAEGAKPDAEKVVRFDAFESQPAKADEGESATDWKAVRKFYGTSRSPKKTADEFGLSVNTIKARIRREGWK